MKKVIVFLTALVMLASFGQAAQAQLACTLMILEGVVEEISDSGDYLIQTQSDGEVMVFVDKETVFAGKENLAPGDFVFVTFNGVMTKSLPPQVTAIKFESYTIDGVVSSLDQNAGTMLMESKASSQVMIRLPDMANRPQEGDFVRVYFNGVMALSYPGQVNGRKIDVFVKAQGEVTETEETYFLMTGDAGIIRVNIEKTSSIEEELSTGAAVDVYYNGVITKSLPPQIFGVVIQGSARNTVSID